MCWKGNTTKDKHIAKKDLKVYKTLDIYGKDGNDAYSVLHGYRYIKNFENKVIKLTTFGYTDMIDEGYHSFSNLIKMIIFRFNHPYSIITEGSLATFIIPEGSLYYKNKSGEIVSERIIYKGLAPWYKRLIKNILI